MEKSLKDAIGANDFECLDVSGKGLTSVYFKEVLAFFRRIDLSKNHLKCVKSLVPYLLECRELVLDGNRISDDLGDVSGLQTLQTSVSLKSNPVCDNKDVIDKLKNQLKIN